MVVFQDIQDVIEWLEPLDYVSFWEAVAPYNLILQDRDHCDGLIARGEVKPGLILEGLKYMAEAELTDAFGLSDRFYHPYVSSMH